MRKLLTGTGNGLASADEVDHFMRLLPKDSAVSFDDIAKVRPERFFSSHIAIVQQVSLYILTRRLQLLTLPTPATVASDSSARRETFLEQV